MINKWTWRKKEVEGKKILVLYIPLSWSSIHRAVFMSIVDMMNPEILEQIEEEFNMVVIPLVHTVFPLDFNRNDAVTKAIQDYQADYIFFGDADQVFPKDTLLQLLRCISDDSPVVTGIYFKKLPPNNCVVGKYLPVDDTLKNKLQSLKEQGFVTETGEQCLMYRSLQFFNIVQPVDIFGMGCVLIRADVFDRIEQPYFKYINGYSTGDYSYDNITEDMWFCAQLKKKGIKTLCNPKVLCGHMVEKIIVGNELVS